MKFNFKKFISNKAVIFTGLVVVIAVGFFGFWHYRDAVFSKEILHLEISGPQTAVMGQEITYVVRYKNNGNFALEQPKLTFELPDYSLTEDSKTRITQDVKDILPGDESLITFKARLLGKEGDVKTARAWLSYAPHNLSARYESDASSALTLTSVPVTVNYDIPETLQKDAPVTYTLYYASSVDYPLENLSIKVDGVPGFVIAGSEPFSLDNKEWKIDTLQKNQSGKIQIRGRATGDVGTHLLLSSHLGMRIDGSFVVLKDITKDVQIVQPQLVISQKINGDSNFTAAPGQVLSYQITLHNFGTTPLRNLFITSKLTGSALNVSTLQSTMGSVNAPAGSVVFDPGQIVQLQTIDPGQEAILLFSVTLKDPWLPADSEKSNPVIKNTVSVFDVTQEFITKVNVMP